MRPDKETVEVPVEAAEVALRELELLINRTRDPAADPELGSCVDYEGHMEPLARARLRIDQHNEADTALRGMEGVGAGLVVALKQIDDVADETGADTTPEDPLQDDVFQALQEFRTALEEASDE